MIAYLKWDSSFFNLKIGSVYLKDPDLVLLQRIYSEKETENYNLVYLQIDAELMNEDLQFFLTQKGALKVDTKRTYIREINQNILGVEGVSNEFIELSPELLELAYTAGHESRFQKDPRLVGKFKLLYRTWLEKSIEKSFADEVYLYRHIDVPVGFITLKKGNTDCQIGLIAVSSDMKGKGIGGKLISQGMYWSYMHSLKTISVVTQAENVEACHFYHKMGFEVIRSTVVFHL